MQQYGDIYLLNPQTHDLHKPDLATLDPYITT